MCNAPTIFLTMFAMLAGLTQLISMLLIQFVIVNFLLQPWFLHRLLGRTLCAGTHACHSSRVGA